MTTARALPEDVALAELERVAHEVRQCLRVTGVAPGLSSWIAQGPSVVALWDALRPNVETRAFEEGADRLRAAAVGLADGLDRLSALGRAQLGESQAFQAGAALLLHHYLTPKLLLLAAAARRALEEPGRPGGEGSPQLIERGAPPRMAALEALDERAAEPGVQRVFKDVRRAREGRAVPLVLRALALWPRYLEAGWDRLKDANRAQGYRAACETLAATAAALAGTLPHPVALPEAELARRGVDRAALALEAAELERMLPAMCLDVALLALDWQAPEILRRSPFPARARAAGSAEVL